MANISLDMSGAYPVTNYLVHDDEEVTDLGAGKTASERVGDYIDVKKEEYATGDRSVAPDPFLKDVNKLNVQYAHLLAVVNGIAEGKYSSTDENPQYVGGVVSAGNRIHTPQEIAKWVLQQVTVFDTL